MKCEMHQMKCEANCYLLECRHCLKTMCKLRRSLYENVQISTVQSFITTSEEYYAATITAFNFELKIIFRQIIQIKPNNKNFTAWQLLESALTASVYPGINIFFLMVKFPAYRWGLTDLIACTDSVLGDRRRIASRSSDAQVRERHFIGEKSSSHVHLFNYIILRTREVLVWEDNHLFQEKNDVYLSISIRFCLVHNTLSTLLGTI